MGKKLTMDQAKSLVDTGVMEGEDIRKLAENGQLEVFRYTLRNGAEKPQIVHTVHAKLVEVIEANAIDLYLEGYRPAIMWKKVGEVETDEE